jgi:hypothetical protein
MTRLIISVWELLLYGGVTYLMTVIMVRGHFLRRRLLAVDR